jgi:predicted permease
MRRICERAQFLQRRQLPMVEDLRYALRSIARTRGVTAVLLLSIALGTGANAAVCSAVYSLFFRAPATLDDDGLVEIYTRQFSGAAYGSSSYPDYRAMRVAPTIEHLAAADDHTQQNAQIGPMSRSARVAVVTASYFAVVGMRTHIGRVPQPQDEASETPAAVISHSLWTDLASPDDVVGRTVKIGQREATVVGVAPPRFRGLRVGRPTDVWVAGLTRRSAADVWAASDERGARRLKVLARLRDGATIESATRDLERISIDLASEHPETNRGTLLDPNAPRLFAATAYAPMATTTARARLVASIVVGAVLLLLVSSCVNAGSLQLARLAARKRELAIKVALGASSRRTIRILVLESVLITLAGAGLGFLFAWWTSDAIPALFAPEHAEMLDTRLDWRLLLFTVLFACAASVIFAIVPVRQGISTPSVALLRGDPGEVSEMQGGSRARALLVCSQVALSTVLLMATVMLIASLSAALRGHSADVAGRMAVVTVKNLTVERASAALMKTRGVESAGWASRLPLSRGTIQEFQVEAGPSSYETVEFAVSSVSTTFFQTIGMKLVEGRFFDGQEGRRTLPVAIVDEALGREHFGSRAVGHHLIDADGVRRLIVGVVRAETHRTLQEPPEPTVYYPFAQVPLERGYVVMRTEADAAPLLEEMSRRITAINGSAELGRTFTLETHFAEALVVDRMTTTLVALCGVLALVMAVVGVYGVMSDAVQRRTREIGLRVALGAGPLHVVRLVLAEAAVLAPVGLVIGTVLALAGRHVAAGLFFGLPGPDLTTLAAAPGVLALVIAIAAALPLRRALAVSPTIALRAQ